MSYIITDQTITVVTDRPYTVARSTLSDDTWRQVLEALNDEDFDRAAELMAPRKALESFFGAAGEVEIRDGQVLLNGSLVQTYAAKKAIEFHRLGLPVKPILSFIERVQKNPSYRAVQDLYRFLEVGNMPLTPDGHFLAYKKVRYGEAGRLVDIHSGQFDNSPGAVVAMARNAVDEDPERTCPNGLHVCSHAYLPHFGSGQGFDAVVTVKVDPADVVAIPRDYNDSKMRVCRYEVVGVLEGYTPSQGHVLGEQPLVAPEIPWRDWTPDPLDILPPGVAHGDYVEVRLRDGELNEGVAGDFDWGHGVEPEQQIVAYRVMPDEAPEEDDDDEGYDF